LRCATVLHRAAVRLFPCREQSVVRFDVEVLVALNSSYGDVPVLLANKRALGRLQDLADIERLEDTS